MKSRQDYIDSGILELYVLGETSLEESNQIAQLAAVDPLLQKEITEIELALERYAVSQSVEPDPLIRPLLLATIDFVERIRNGEQASITPVLNKNSKISDYSEWLSRKDMVLPEEFEDVYAKILTHTETLTCAIVWIKEMAPQEVHDKEFEKFLIIEGTCTITIEEQVHHLVAGDFLTIPLHKSIMLRLLLRFPAK